MKKYSFKEKTGMLNLKVIFNQVLDEGKLDVSNIVYSLAMSCQDKGLEKEAKEFKRKQSETLKGIKRSEAFKNKMKEIKTRKDVTIEDVCELRNNGNTLKEISTILNCGVGTVRRRLEKYEKERDKYKEGV